MLAVEFALGPSLGLQWSVTNFPLRARPGESRELGVLTRGGLNERKDADSDRVGELVPSGDDAEQIRRKIDGRSAQFRQPRHHSGHHGLRLVV